MSTPTTQLRTIKGVPFAWQDKRILRRIREEVEDYPSATLVYLALTIAASDTGSDEFKTTQSWLAQLSGVTDRTVRRRLLDLQQLGLIEVSTPRLRAPSTYRLLAIGHSGRTIGHQFRTIGHGEGTSVSTIRRKVRKGKATARSYTSAVERTAERYRRNGQEESAARTEEIEHQRVELLASKQ
jgi:predicted transcriptional regulator